MALLTLGCEEVKTVEEVFLLLSKAKETPFRRVAVNCESHKTRFSDVEIFTRMARKERDGLLSQDHQYACKNYNYLTPPSTPSFEVLGNEDDSDLLDKDTFLPEQFSLYMPNGFTHSDDADPFFDFAEDFQDLRLPLLKKDCMWGTAAQIRSSRTSPECSSDSVTTCSTRNMTATPLPLDFRSTTTTPVYFDTSYGSNHFMPISSTVSPSEIENRPKDLISPFRASSNSQVTQLLSPNETESGEYLSTLCYHFSFFF